MPGKFLLVMMAIFLVAAASSPAQQGLQGEEDWGRRPVIVEIGRFGFVTRGQGEYIRNAITRASASGASAIVLRINCPGGFACELRRFVESILKVKLPVIAWVDGAAAGAGAIAALSADKVFFSENAFLGGEVEAIDWRGPAEDLPKRLTDLRYHDLAEELGELLSAKGRAKDMIKGFCDPDEEVVLNGLKYSSPGDVLTLDPVMAGKAGIAGGLVDGLEALLADCEVAGEPVMVPIPQTNILRDRRGDKNSETEAGGAAETEKAQASGALQEEGQDDKEKLAFGQTRLESYRGKVVVIPVEMESLMRETKFEFMKRVIKKADDDQASAIIFDLNTPGGIAWYTEEIMLADLQKISIPTYSFVNPKAMSAGALIAIATDHIYMHPPSTIGAAAPVMGGGQDIPETMLKKVMSDLLSTADDVARRKGHNPEIAKAFIDSKVELSFDLPFISPEGAIESRDAFAPDTENDLLVLNSTQAVEIIDGRPLFAEGTANSIEDLIAQEGLEGDVVLARPLGFEKVADWIVKLAPWLLLLGIAGAYMELKAPGFGIPGFTALICFGLFFFGHSVAGYMAGFESLGIFLLGIVLVILEFFVFPGLLIFGVTGFALIFGSLIFAMIDPLKLDWDGGFSMNGVGALLSGPLINLTIAVIGAGVVILLLLRYLPSMPGFRGLVLESDVGQGTGLVPPTGGEGADLIGVSGSAETDLRPAGIARIGGEVFDVVSTGGFIEAGNEVRIVEHEGARIVVEQVGSGD